MACFIQNSITVYNNLPLVLVLIHLNPIHIPILMPLISIALPSYQSLGHPSGSWSFFDTVLRFFHQIRSTGFINLNLLNWITSTVFATYYKTYDRFFKKFRDLFPVYTARKYADSFSYALRSFGWLTWPSACSVGQSALPSQPQHHCASCAGWPVCPHAGCWLPQGPGAV